MRRRGIVGGWLCSLLLVACGKEEPAPLTWERFLAAAHREPGSGVYVVDGDEVADDLAELRAWYDDYRVRFAELQSGQARLEQPLIVNRVWGRDDRWSFAQAHALTYCVDRAGFGDRYDEVAAALSAAAEEWEATASVDFIHDPSQDDDCSAANPWVLFDVRRVSGQPYLARAFFPSSSRGNRNILVDEASLGDIGPWTLTGVLRHELGHALGFRHEHTRLFSSWAFQCFENFNYRSLTSYDAASVMHYPHCNGTNGGDLELTARDRAGARALYP